MIRKDMKEALFYYLRRPPVAPGLQPGLNGSGKEVRA